jgi:RHS repeat-associated protein
MFAGKLIAYAVDGTLTTTAAGHLGSTELTNTNGSINRQTYLPYGSIRSNTTNQLTTDRTYTGQVDDGLGWMHYRARQYDPTLGRFLQADTITVDGLNRYTYVRNNPLNATDPTGKFVFLLPVVPLAGVIVAATAAVLVTNEVANPGSTAAAGQAIIDATVDIGGALGGYAKPADGTSTCSYMCYAQPGYADTSTSELAELPGLESINDPWAGDIPGFAVDHAGLSSLTTQATKAEDKGKSGIYIVTTDKGTYVGQSSDIWRRLTRHNRGFSAEEIANAITYVVDGGKLAREIAEQLKIDLEGGIDNLLNERNPIGEARFDKMPDQPYTRGPS